MINGSQVFNEAVNEGGYPYKVKLSHEGTVIDCDISSCKVYKGSTGNDAFSIGSIYIPYIEVEAVELTAPIFGKELKLEVGVMITDEQTEWIKLGYFTVSKTSGSVANTKFTAVGRIAAVLPKIQVSVSSSMAPAQLIQATQTAVREAGYSDFTIDTTGVTLSTAPITDLSNTNAQRIIEILAGVVGAYATEDNNGNIVLFKYDTTNYIEYDGSRMTQYPVTHEEDFELLNVKVIKTEEYEQDDGTIVPEVSFISGEPYEWVVMNSNMTAELFPAYCQNCLGLSYRPATINFAYGDPRLEAKDILQITDVDEAVYLVPCMTLIHNIAGGITTEVIAPHQGEGEIDSESEMGGKGPITQQIDAMGRNLMSTEASAAQAKTAAAQAKTAAASAKADAASAKVDAASAKADAASAKTDANTAKQQAISATSSANTALMGLSQVESVIDALNWIASHGTYTKATTYVEGTTYYTLTGVVEPSPYADRKYYVLSGGIYVQTNVEATAVAEPVVGDIDTYYELLEGRYTLTEDTKIDPDKTYYTISDTYYITTGTPVSIPKPEDISLYYTLNVRDAIGDYVQTHLAVTNDGLYVMTDKLQWKVLIASDGVYIINPEGENVAKYKDTITIGKDDGTEGAQFIDYRSVRVYDDTNMALIATGHEDEATPYFWVSNLKDKQSNFEMIITHICTQDGISEMIIPGYYGGIGWPTESVYLASLSGVEAAINSFNTAIVEIDGVEYTKDSYLYLPKNISQRTYDFTLSKPAPEGAQIVVKCVKDTQDRNNRWALVEDQIFYSDGITTQFNFETERLYPYDYIQIITDTDIIKVPPLQFNKGTNNKLSRVSTGLWYSPNTEITIKYTATSSAQVPAFTLGKRTSGKGVGPYSCVIGQDCVASAPQSFSGGKDTITTGQRSFAYGIGCKAIGGNCIAVGTEVTAGYSSAAFGRDTIAERSGFAAGILTTSSGYNAFAEGGFTKAIGDCSHTSGFGTVAEDGNFVIGTYNIPDSSSASSWGGSVRAIDTPEEYPSSLLIGTQHAFVIGNGINEETRSNAFAVDWDGDVELALDTTAQSGDDHDIYTALQRLGWANDVIV